MQTLNIVASTQQARVLKETLSIIEVLIRKWLSNKVCSFNVVKLHHMVNF